MQNRPKMVPGRCLGGAWGLPGASRGQVQGGFHTQPKIDETTDGSRDVLGGNIAAILGPQRAQKSAKNATFWENGGPRVVIFLIFAGTGPANHFSIDFFKRKINNKR